MHGTARKPTVHFLLTLPFILMHLAALSIFFVPFAWKWVGLCLALYLVRMFAITAGYHRYFSHRTYKIGRLTQFLFAFVGGTSAQKGALWWAAHHRHHHRFSDQAEDIHSPIRSGFWWSHMGWITSIDYEDTRWEQIPDLAKYPELVWLNKFHLVPPTMLGLSVLALSGWSGIAWGFFLSTVLLWHGTFTINSLSHVFGTRRYATTDTSRNNFWLALLTLGEGWHNNHHCYQSSTNQGFFWWEIDVSYSLLKALSWVGVTRDLRKPPLKLLEAKLINSNASRQSGAAAANEYTTIENKSQVRDSASPEAIFST